MPAARVTWSAGQAVHRPGGFLVGERLQGTVQSIRPRDPMLNFDVVEVQWADGSSTDELSTDLDAGPVPQHPQPGLFARLAALLH